MSDDQTDPIAEALLELEIFQRPQPIFDRRRMLENTEFDDESEEE